MLRAASSSIRLLWRAIRSDHEQIQRYHAKYHAERFVKRPLAADLVQKIGLQMLAATRVMQGLEQAGVPLLPQVASRLIRHVYGAEIHWKAHLDPGVVIIHGNGVVISHAARVGAGCILFQNVTLGESIDPETRELGAPTLGSDVHVGPGATLLGPISVGDRSKIMAGTVLTRSVPPDSLVCPAEPSVGSRRQVAHAVAAPAGE